MDFGQFEALGDRIRLKLSQANFDELQLPHLAAEALSQADLSNDFCLEALADFLLETNIKQQPSLRFSNLPPVVYRCEEFYIELLVWVDATTLIHQHAFSGAFRVLAGSSFHSVYAFEERERVSSRLLLGAASLENCEILRAGDVRAIHSGRSGLLHALFHLDRPSVTVVVRSHSEPWAQPQYALALPNIAYAHAELQRDSKVRMLSRLLAVAAAIDPDQVCELFVTRGSQLDFPRLFMLLVENHGHLNNEERLQRFISAARDVHGDIVEHLPEVIARAQREGSIIQARNSSQDPELRFFLALLLNLPSKDWIYRMIEARYPTNSPQDLCCHWLQRLRKEENTSTAFFELAKKAKLGVDRLGARLNSAISFPAEDHRSEAVLRAVADGDRCGAAQNNNGNSAERVALSHEELDAYTRIKGLGEFSPLFSSDASSP